MKKFIVYYLLLLPLLSFGQENLKKIQNTIDQEVWEPFTRAFETLNAEALNAIYADEVLRVTPNGIDTKSEFKQENIKRFAQNKIDGISITLDFWFDDRDTNEDTSYEVGFYRIGLNKKEAKTSYIYGQFHIVLKKVNGTWKITQDWDTTTINGKKITSKDFDKKGLE